MSWRDLPPMPLRLCPDCGQERDVPADRGDDWPPCPGCGSDAIPVPGRPTRPDTARQTFLRTFQQCPRSAALGLLHDGGAPAPQLERGSAFHLFAERAMRLMVEQNEEMLPGELAKDLLSDLWADPSFTLPADEAESLRIMAWHFAEHTRIDPASVLAIEQKFELELGGWTLTGTIDVAFTGDSQRVRLRDYKSSPYVPPQDDYGIPDEDGVYRGARDFQLSFYALLFAEGKPVDSPFGLGERTAIFDLEQAFPMYVRDEGGLVTRGVTLTLAELQDFKTWLVGRLAALDEAFVTGKWQAVPGSKQCGECTARGLCPLPPALRDERAVINTPEDAERAATELLLMRDTTSAYQRELRNFAEAHRLVIPYGDDKVLGFKKEETRRTDSEGMAAGAERAARYGEPFDPDDYIKRSESTKFKPIKWSELEDAPA